MDVAESIQSLVVQNPPGEHFSSGDLIWTKIGNVEHNDEVALIPYDRVDAFIVGECSNVECPTRFHIERGRKRTEGSLKEYRPDEYLEYRMYWCSFGPENYGEGGGILPSRRYRLNTRNRAARPQSMRGCTCHFVVKRLYACPSLALLIFNNRRHVNKSGFVCHGPLDRDAIGPGAKNIPYICNEIQQQTMSMIYLGIPEENVLEKHIEGIQRYCDSDAKVNSLASQYVHKLGMIIKRSTYELDLDDQASIRMWVERNKKSVFIYQDTSERDPFILGIQTEWQLQQMIRFGHHSILAVSSTFGIKKLKYPLCTLLVFDSRQLALPVAWIITRSIAKLDVNKWMKALFARVHSTDPTWKLNGVLIDDAATEIDPIREALSCPIIFSLWRVRRSWLRNVCKKCANIIVQRELMKRLSDMVYSIWGGGDHAVTLEELTQDFVDQTDFMQYFTSTWVPKIEMWLTTMKSFPLASIEASCAIEAYHVKLKSKLYDDSHLGALQRVDWLVHKLTTELHSSYWLDRYADESDSFQNVKEDYIASSSWHRALQIPDTAVSLESGQHPFAKVLSQKDNNVVRLIWNAGSEFAHCGCEWSMQGNLCKHVIKVNMMCGSIQGHIPSMSFRSFQEILMDLMKKPMDDSIALDLSMAWTHQMVDQVQQLVELSASNNIGHIVKNMPLNWAAKKSRTSCGKPASAFTLTPSSRNCATISSTPRSKTQKRKRLSRIG
ncbi:unnamed protein product [Cuscuta campestris]|uniref:SWIM-type domain-containing protein n=1 Tax=Cuscuta campestris TaxID=132261 RepID=A0A484NNA3_9ASTE|nr:unnamed protein product [Cuscuta campestris]